MDVHMSDVNPPLATTESQNLGAYVQQKLNFEQNGGVAGASDAMNVDTNGLC